MAVFNPGPIPQGRDEMPDWTKVTRPVSDIQADKSTGIALATVGNAIEGAANIAETTAKDIINKDVRNTVEPIREDYTNTLLATKAALQGSGQYVQPAASDMDLTKQGQYVSNVGPVPAAIDAGINKVNRIQGLLTYGSGKLGVDETYYDMRLKTAVTDLRARYPGFVDYIDQKVASITGMNPANETLRDLTHQIAQLQTSRKTEYDKEVDLARRAMADGMMGARQQFETLLQRGAEYLPTWRQWYEGESRKWQEIKERDAIRQDASKTKEEYAKTRKEDWTNFVSTTVSSAANTLVTVTGMDKPMTAVELMEDFQKNPNKYNPEQISEFAAKLRAQGASLGAQLDMEANKVKVAKDGSRYSYNSDVGANEVKTVKDTIMGYYKNMEDALMTGGPQGAGMAFYWARQAAAMGENTKFKVYSGPEGEKLRLWKVIKDDMGDQAVPNLMTGIVKANVDQSINSLFEKAMLDAKTQKDGKTGQPLATPYTFKDMNDKAFDLEGQGQINKAMRGRYINGGMELMLKDITDPTTNDVAKTNALKFFFSPEGQGVLNQFNNDRSNPITGKYEPGKQSVWSKFTSDALVKEVKKLSDKDPTIGRMYTQWIRSEAAASLYYKDFLDLQTITGREDLWIKYNDGKDGGVPHITLMEGKGSLASPVGERAKVPNYGVNPDYIGVDVGRRTPYEGQIKRANETINRVNEALRGVDRVTKGLGGDSSQELLGFLIQAQAYTGKNWEGIPKDIMDAIAAAQGKGKLQDLYEKQKKAKESK